MVHAAALANSKSLRRNGSIIRNAKSSRNFLAENKVAELKQHIDENYVRDLQQKETSEDCISDYGLIVHLVQKFLGRTEARWRARK